jgi:hypothetical protein
MQLHNEYRKDWRTDDEFAKDILEGHKAEREIIEKYANHLRKKYNIEVTIEDNGTDNSGKVVEESQVNTKADYILNGTLIEVKFINNQATEFRFKKDQIKSYIKQGATILLVNGWKTDNPTFTIIKPDKLQEITRTNMAKPFKTWGYKLCYFLRSYAFKWYKFEG